MEEFDPVFTVKAATETEPAKKVKFAPGNLYWDGSEFKFEEHQYDYKSSRDASHVRHFFWSKNARVAYAADYAAANTEFGITPAKTDTFFAADGGAIEGYTVLDKTEWRYLIVHALEKASDKPKVVTVAGKKCVILKPDGFNGTVADTYTADQWAAAETTGLVALPFAGNYSGSIVNNAGTLGHYWSASPESSSASKAWYAYFDSGDANTNFSNRNDGRVVRLVSVVE